MLFGAGAFLLAVGLPFEDEKGRELTSVRPDHQHRSDAQLFLAACFDTSCRLVLPECDGDIRQVV